MVTAAEQRGGEAQLDQAGRLVVASTNESMRFGARELTTLYRELLGADLTLLGWRVVSTATGHLGMLTFAEGAGATREFWVGVALRADVGTALRDAGWDALLAPWNGSVLAAGAARLIAADLCCAAVVADHLGTTSLGAPTDLAPLTALALEDTPGLRLAARNANGEFRALTLGSASVRLNLVPGPKATDRVDQWFDALESALV